MQSNHFNLGYILYKVKINQIRTCILRNYIIDEEDEKLLKMNESELINYYKEKSLNEKINFNLAMNKNYLKKDGSGDGNYFYFLPMGSEKIVCMDKITPFNNFCMSSNIKNFDIISHAPIHFEIAKKIKNKSFILWTYEELSIYPFDSIYVPKYHIMSRDEKNEMFYDENDNAVVQKSKLISIKQDDVIVKFYRAEIGDVFSVIEEQNYVCSLSNSRLTFRVVVSGSIFTKTKKPK